jgi:hypothetical protein
MVRPDPPPRLNAGTQQAPANGQAGAGTGLHSFIRSFVGPPDETGAEAQPGQGEAVAEPAAVESELPTVLSRPAIADEFDFDFDEVLARVEAEIAARPKPKLALNTVVQTPWGVPARLSDVYEGWAKLPVDLVDGVTVTPVTMLYRLVMDSKAKDECPALAGRGMDLGNGKTILDLPIAEVEAWTKA